MSSQQTPPEPPAWKSRPGEPQLKVVTEPGSGRVALQSMAVGVTAALVLRSEQAIWLGEQLIEQGRLAKSGLVIAGPSSIPPATS